MYGVTVGLGQDDWATPAQRARLTFLGTQLKALGVSIGQAQARGDDATVARLRALVAPIQREVVAIRAAIVRQAEAGERRAEERPGGVFQPVLDALKGAGMAAAVGLGVLAYLVLRR